MFDNQELTARIESVNKRIANQCYSQPARLDNDQAILAILLKEQEKRLAAKSTAAADNETGAHTTTAAIRTKRQHTPDTEPEANTRRPDQPLPQQP